MNVVEVLLRLSLRGACINDIANLTNGTAEYNNASASKWSFNYANRHRYVPRTITKMFNSCQAGEWTRVVRVCPVTSTAIKTEGTYVRQNDAAHIKLN